MNQQKLLDKAECLALLCSKANSHWSFIRFLFQIPIIIIATVMVVMNSFTSSGDNIRIANVVVNGCNILVLSFFNQLRVAEKSEHFKNISNDFMKLSHIIESCDIENMIPLSEKYDSLVIQVLFEDIPNKYKKEVINIFKNRYRPIQLNGCSGFITEPSSPIGVIA